MVVRAARVLSGRFRRVPFRRSPPLRNLDNILRPQPVVAEAAITTLQRCVTSRATSVATATAMTTLPHSSTSGHRALLSFAVSNSVRRQERTLWLLFVPKRELSVSPREDSNAGASTAGLDAGVIREKEGPACGHRERASGTSSSDASALEGVASRGGKAVEAVAVGVGGEEGRGDAVQRQRTRAEKEEEEEGVVDREEDRVAEEEASRIWTLPNAVTVGRICFCPVLGGLIVTSQHELALAGLLAASLTDWLDGYIARKWNQKSVLGGFLDPLADKIMVATVALALGREGIMPEPLVALMVGRDALLVAASLAHRTLTKEEGDGFFNVRSVEYRVSPSILSKVNTGLQFGTLWVGLTNAVYHIPGDIVFSGLCLLTGGATLASGANYFLESGLKPTSNLGKRIMLRRESLREKCLESGALVKEQMDMRRERFRIKKGQLKERLREEKEVVAGALKSTISARKSESHLHEGGR